MKTLLIIISLLIFIGCADNLKVDRIGNGFICREINHGRNSDIYAFKTADEAYENCSERQK